MIYSEKRPMHTNLYAPACMHAYVKYNTHEYREQNHTHGNMTHFTVNLKHRTPIAECYVLYNNKLS